MSVTKKEVKHIAYLAKLEIGEDEIERYTEELNQILSYTDKLNELDTSGVEPLSYPIEYINVFREDTIVPSFSTEKVLKNAPDRSDTHFRVPKVIKIDK